MAEIVETATTDGGTTLVLKRRPNQRFDSAQYEYWVTEQGSSGRVGQYEPTRADGESQLYSTLADYDRAESSSQGSSGGMGIPGIGGGMDGGPSVSFGFDVDPMGKEKDDNDDSPPWMW